MLCIVIICLYAYESFLANTPALNPTYFSIIGHLVILLATFVTIAVFHIGKSAAWTIVTGFATLTFSLMVLQKNQIANYQEYLCMSLRFLDANFMSS